MSADNRSIAKLNLDVFVQKFYTEAELFDALWDAAKDKDEKAFIQLQDRIIKSHITSYPEKIGEAEAIEMLPLKPRTFLKMAQEAIFA